MVQPLDGDSGIIPEKVRLPAVTGEQENLAVFRLLPQPAEGGGAALAVKAGQSVVQNDGYGLLRRQHQLADGQPDRQIQLIRRASGEENGFPGDAAAILGEDPKGPVQGDAAVRAAGQFGENLCGPLAQCGGKRPCRAVLACSSAPAASSRALYSVSRAAISSRSRSAPA